MAIKRLGYVPEVVVPSTSAATAAPGPASDGFTVGGNNVAAWIDYGTGVTACELQLWLQRPGSTAWFRGQPTDGVLTPASGDQIVIFRGVPDCVGYLQVVSVTGGSVTVYVSGAN